MRAERRGNGVLGFRQWCGQPLARWLGGPRDHLKRMRDLRQLDEQVEADWSHGLSTPRGSWT